MALGCTVVSTVTRLRSLVRNAPASCATRRLSASRNSSFSPRLPPMAQVGALVREGVLEELLAGEVLEIGVIDPTFTHLLVGEREDVLEQQQPNDEASLDPGPGFVAVGW